VSRSSASPAERAYLDLVARYQSAILNYLYRLVGDADLAEDLTQETYVKAYGAIERLDLAEDAEARRRAWLYRIAHNTATDHLRRRARLQWLSLDRLRAHGSGDPADAMADRQPVQQAMAQLTEEQRQVLQLFIGEGLSANEVGEVLGISAAAARKRRQRARGAFQAAYQAMEDDT
jgi:RNA polymerase sigma-70 factor (ECF subfamily)